MQIKIGDTVKIREQTWLPDNVLPVATVVEVLNQGRAIGLKFENYPNVVDYGVNEVELVKSA